MFGILSQGAMGRVPSLCSILLTIPENPPLQLTTFTYGGEYQSQGQNSLTAICIETVIMRTVTSRPINLVVIGVYISWLFDLMMNRKWEKGLCHIFLFCLYLPCH